MKKLLTTILTTALLCNPAVSLAADNTGAIITYDHGYIEFFEDREYTKPYSSMDSISAGDTVYYKILPSDGYACRSIEINSTDADSNSFVMPEDELVMKPDLYIRGDSDENGKLNLTDVSILLKYIVGDTGTYWTYRHNEYRMDFSLDGNLNLTDAAMMLQKIADFDGIKETDLPLEPEITSLCGAAKATEYLYTSHITGINGKLNYYESTLYDLNKTVLNDTDELKDYIMNTMTVISEFYEFSDGSYSRSDVNPYSLRERYNEEFFEEYALIPRLISTNYRFTVSDIYRTDSELRIDLDIHGKIDSYGDNAPKNVRTIIFIEVPKSIGIEEAVFGSHGSPDDLEFIIGNPDY